ncbi:MAG: chemotaxis protein CheW [Deltaproteobacteria bacterium]|nr:chemotaxis protein CheW [Deltaproteobacteria bacterium]
MTDRKHDASSTARKVGSLFDKIEEITQLENQVVALKKKLLLDSAQGVGDEQLEKPSFLLVNVTGRIFAAPLIFVDEIVEMPQIQPLPAPISSIAGTVNYHGDLLAVVDVEELTTSKSGPVNASQVLVICTIDQRRVALKVDEAVEVITVDASRITMSDEVMPGILKSSGLLTISADKSALILDIMWIGIGAHLGTILSHDAATPQD